MFDDILGEDNVKEEEKIVSPRSKINVRGVGIVNKDKYKPSPPTCDNCLHGSHILSNFPGKVLCQKYKRHKDITYVCRNWELRK